MLFPAGPGPRCPPQVSPLAPLFAPSDLLFCLSKILGSGKPFDWYDSEKNRKVQELYIVQGRWRLYVGGRACERILGFSGKSGWRRGSESNGVVVKDDCC